MKNELSDAEIKIVENQIFSKIPVLYPYDFVKHWRHLTQLVFLNRVSEAIMNGALDFPEPEAYWRFTLRVFWKNFKAFPGKLRWKLIPYVILSKKEYDDLMED